MRLVSLPDLVALDQILWLHCPQSGKKSKLRLRARKPLRLGQRKKSRAESGFVPKDSLRKKRAAPGPRTMMTSA